MPRLLLPPIPPHLAPGELPLDEHQRLDAVDYRVQVGDTEIRVQKSIRQAFAQERETCRLAFNACNWYDGN
jgi:hypothetical protein